MIKKLLFLLCLFAVTGVKSQAPSYDLETWLHTPGSQFGPEYDQPSGWTSTNVLTAFGNAVSVTKVSDAHAGSAARIETIKINNNPNPEEIPDTSGIMFTGGLTIGKINYGFPYGERSRSLQFYCKYTPVGTDTASVVVLLTKWNTGTNMQDVVGTGIFRTNVNATYSLAEIEIDYAKIPWTNPDSATIVVSSSGKIRPKIGSVFFVDDFVFTAPNGILLQKDVKPITVFPNPVNNFINFSFLPKEVEQIEITDIAGKNIVSYFVKDQRVAIDMSGFAPGIYIYSVNGNNEVLKRGKFVK